MGLFNEHLDRYEKGPHIVKELVPKTKLKIASPKTGEKLFKEFLKEEKSHPEKNFRIIYFRRIIIMTYLIKI